jgi:formyltetrahydrofolate-dependent phosphoribosylglycinamide formyltransferase
MQPLKIAVLISGGGTTLDNLHARIQVGQLNAEIVQVISSKSKAGGVAKAQGYGYSTKVIGRRKYASDEAFSEAIGDAVRQAGAQLIVLGGFLKRFLPPVDYAQRCINIHPSLIPSFCGAGYYGMRVHEAVWRKGCRVSGCTVHLVNEIYDEGPIIVQRAVALEDSDDPSDIQRKVFELECEALPLAISYFAEDRIRFENGRAVIQ